MGGEVTRTAILDTAERLFAANGFEATSLRHITTEANVNLAAVHYHFGSKEKLIQAVFARRVEPVNRHRLELLDQLESAATRSGRPPEVGDILRAFIEPPLKMSDESSRSAILRLLSRTYLEPRERAMSIFTGQFSEVAGRFVAALRKALPHLPEEEIFWRLHFAVGTMAHTLADSWRLQFLSGGRCDPDDVDDVARRLVAFVTAGFTASQPAGQTP